MELLIVFGIILLIVGSFIYYIYYSCKQDDKQTQKNKEINQALLDAENKKPKSKVRIYLKPNQHFYRETSYFFARGFNLGNNDWFKIASSKERCELYIERSFKEGYFEMLNDEFIPVAEVMNVCIMRETNESN